MAKTVFVPNSPVTSAFLNAINNPTFVANPANDGEISLIRDANLDPSPGSLLARSNEFLNAFSATPTNVTGLLVTISAGTLILSDGTPVAKPTTQIAIPASSTRIVWIDPFGVFQQGANNPNDGSVLLARVTTDATKITATVDLRPRFKIGTVNYNAPAAVGQSAYFEFPVIGREFIDEMGWTWLNPKNDVYISKSGAGGDVAKDGYERLFKRLWTNAGMAVFNSSRVQVAKGATADADWVAGRQLGIPGRMGRMPVSPGVNDGVTYNEGDLGGARQVAITSAQMPAHSHAIADPGHRHPLLAQDFSGDGATDSLLGVGTALAGENRGNRSYTFTNGSGESLTQQWGTGITGTQNTGSDQAHENMSPYFVSTRLIFTGVLAA